jgi:hypothetical protein
VEGNDHGSARDHTLAIDADVVACGNLRARLETRAAVHFHPARLDELVALAAGSHGAGGEEFVDAGAFFHGAGVECPVRETVWVARVGRKSNPEINLRVWSSEGPRVSGRLAIHHAP